jgi:succinyl-diaminopimelate desuccinylase
MNTLQLTKSLIAQSSVTPEDKDCQQQLIKLLTPLGFVCKTITSNGVTNLWARRGTKQPLFVFAGHTDVVPTGPAEEWASAPFQPTERRGRHEDVDCRDGRGVPGIRRQLSRPLRLDRLPDHQR